jgi:ATP synthase protein I
MRSFQRVVLPVLAATLVAALVFGIGRGVDGVLGAVLGGIVVILFLGSTPVILTPLVRASAALSLPVALGFLATKSVAVLVVLALLFDLGGAADHIDPTAFGVAAIAASIVWTALQIVAFRNERVPTYDLTSET